MRLDRHTTTGGGTGTDTLAAESVIFSSFPGSPDTASAAKTKLYFPPNTTIQVPSTYSVPDGGHVDWDCIGGKVTLTVPSKYYGPLLQRALGLNACTYLRLRNIVFQGNGTDGSDQQIGAVAWNGAGDVGSYLTLGSTAGYNLPNVNGAPVAPECRAYLQKTGNNVRANFTYTGISGNRLTGLNINPLTAGPGNTSVSGWYCDQSGNKVGVNLYNLSDGEVIDCEFNDWYGAGLVWHSGVQRRLRRNAFRRIGAPFGRTTCGLNDDYQHQPADSAGIWGYDWIQDNYFEDSWNAPIGLGLSIGNTPAVQTPKKKIVTGNIVKNSFDGHGIDSEIGENDQVIFAYNEIYSTLGGINCALGDAMQSFTPSAQAVSSGGNFQATANQLVGAQSPAGKLLINLADGSTTLLAYTGIDTTNNRFTGVTPAFTFYGDETVSQWNPLKRVLIVGNIVDSENVAQAADASNTKSGIRVHGGSAIIEGNKVRYNGPVAGIQAGTTQSVPAFGLKIRGNEVVIANTDPTYTTLGIDAEWFHQGDVSGNTVTWETPNPAASGMQDGIYANFCKGTSFIGNRVYQPGRHGIRVTNTTSSEFELNKVWDAGQMAGPQVGAITEESGCWDNRFFGNRGRWSGSGYRYDYGLWVKNGGGQETELEHNSMVGWATAAFQDDQSASTTVSGAQTVGVSGNVKLAAGTSVPVNGGIVVVNGVTKTYNRFVASVTAHVRGAQTVSNGGQLNVNSVADLPDQGTATIDGVTVSWTGRAGALGTADLSGCTITGGSHSFPDGAAFTVTNVMVGLSAAGTYSGGETVAITANSFVYGDSHGNRTTRI